jgi:hypothetical protein
MATQGPKYAGTGASLANAGSSENANAWLTPTNIGADDASEAQITAATYDSPDISEILVASAFGFTIPTDATINGITVEIDRRGFTSTNSGKDFRVQLATGTTFADLVGDNKAAADIWQASPGVKTYGGAADTWNAGLTEAQVNAAGFAVFLSAYANVANADIGVDFIRVTITYTASTNLNISVTAAAGTGAIVDAGKSLAVNVTAATGTGVATNPTVTVAGSATSVEDHFERSVTDGWGSADVSGGAYTISGTAADFDVGSGVGTISLAAGVTRNARLAAVSMLEQDGINEFELSVVPTGGSFFFDIVRRSQNTDQLKDSYWLELVVTVTPQFQLVMLRRNTDGSSTTLGSNTFHSLTPTAATRYKVRVQTTGTNPTTIQAKLWLAASAEPAGWDRSETDSTAALQVAGAVGFRAVTASGVTNGPVLLTFDNFSVLAAQPSGTNVSVTPAAGTGAVVDAGKNLAINVVAATGTGVATNPGRSVASSPSAATGTGAVVNAGRTVAVNAAAATGTGLATNAGWSASGAATNVNVTAATGTGTATNAGRIISPAAAAAAGTGAIVKPTVSMAINAAAASGTGVATNATWQTTSALNVSVTAATGIGAVGTPTASIAPRPTAASGTGLASNATWQTATALNVSVTAASGIGLVTNAKASLLAQAIAAAGTGAAANPMISGSSSSYVFAQSASGTGTARNARIGSSGGFAPVGHGRHARPKGHAVHPKPIPSHPSPKA